MTTHYIEEAEQLCDRVAIVDDGDIAAIDSPAALKESLGGDVVSLAVDGPVEDVCDRLDARTWAIGYETNEAGDGKSGTDGEPERQTGTTTRRARTVTSEEKE